MTNTEQEFIVPNFPTSNIQVVIMAGGIGERFWPLSQPNRPKQLLPFGTNNNMLIQDALKRALEITSLENVWISTSKELKPVFEEMELLPNNQILAEPCGRNTAGCLSFVLANLLANPQGNAEDTVMTVLTADQRIEPTQEFVKVANVIIQYVAEHNMLGIIGIPPVRPDTGFGYIETIQEQGKNINGVNIYPVKKFHEKPSADIAKVYLEAGNYYWNSGMFFWKVKTFLDEIKTVSPIHWDAIMQMSEAIIKGNIPKIDDIFTQLPNISIDYALMEKTKNVIVAEATFQWDDLGAWTSLERVFQKDTTNNIVHGDVVCLRTNNSIIYNDESIPLTIATLGIENLVIAISHGIVLVMNKEEAQNLKQLIDRITKRKDEK